MDILFNLVKNGEYIKLEQEIDSIIRKNYTIDDIDLNTQDENNNYFIIYLIIANKYDLLKKLLTIKAIKLDIYDHENKNILYIPIRYNYKKRLFTY
jgi:hypothetical protein